MRGKKRHSARDARRRDEAGRRERRAPQVQKPRAPGSFRAPVRRVPVRETSSQPLSDYDVYLFAEGSHGQIWRHLGAHPVRADAGAAEARGALTGTRFAVWAPNAERVSVIGSFNAWNESSHALAPRGASGIWEGTFADVGPGDLYKYRVFSRYGHVVDKRDPCGFYGETPPATASVVWERSYAWQDGEWMRTRASRAGADAPMAIYELHLGSWRRFRGDQLPTYREVAEPLAEHVGALGFTHVELMPIAEHPFYGSWGYQSTGYYAPSARYGTPADLKYLIDRLHAAGIGVLLDWVPSHFPTDESGLAYFDGTHLYEHADPRRGFHPEWSSYLFNYGRNEVKSFLISNALYWLDEFHFDGLRVDAVASMLYLDYARRPGEWIPNEHGGREDLEAVAFLRGLNEQVRAAWPDVTVIAEESTSWPLLTRPVAQGGLGFGMKWDMGWMHDTLDYFARDPLFRRHHHRDVTFRSLYAPSECFVLPLSHDEVVYGKRSLIGKMPGDDWQRFANLRLLMSCMYAQPGKKLLFMGGEFAQEREWSHGRALDWELAERPANAGLQRLVAALNGLHRELPALHARDCAPEGFEWIQADDAERSIFAFLRRDGKSDALLVVLNCTPVPRHNHRIGVPVGGAWREVLNSDAKSYGGSGQGNLGEVEAAPIGADGRPFSLNLVLPPLGAVFLAPVP